MLLVLLLCCLSKLQAQITRTKPQMQPKELQLKYINECCRSSIRSDEILLHKCTNASAEQSLLDGWMEPSSTKNKRIALVSHATKEILGYASFTFAINQVYSEHNNYLFRMADPKTTNYEPRDARWNKVMILDKALQTWAKEVCHLISFYIFICTLIFYFS